MGLEDGGEDSFLQPAGVEFRIGLVHALRLLVTAYVVAPPGIAYVGCLRGEFRQISQHLPGGVGISRKTYLITVAAYAAPAMVDHRTGSILALAGAAAGQVVPEGIVEPEGVAEALDVFAFAELLPVEPPEIHSLLLDGMQHGVEVGIRPLLLVHAEGDVGGGAVGLEVVLRAVVVAGAGEVIRLEALVGLFEDLQAGCRVQVEGGLEMMAVEFLEGAFGLGEEFLLPGVSSPAQALPGLVLAPFGLAYAVERNLLLPVGIVPVHVDDEHVGGDVIGVEVLRQVHQFGIGVQPIAAPPVSQGVFGREGDAAGDLHEVAKGLCVLVAVCEDVPVDTLAFGALFHPVFPVGIHRHQQVAVGFIYQSPSVAGDDSGVEGVLGQPALRVVDVDSVVSVEGAAGAEQVAGGIVPGLPAILVEGYLQVAGVELGVALVGEDELAGIDSQRPPALPDFELRNGEFAVHYTEGGVVFEFAVCSPFHTDQLRGKHREAGITLNYRGGLVCLGMEYFLSFGRDSRQGHQYREE